jgi:Beta-lactamase.
MASERAVGHTGFTGTAFTVDLETGAISVLLTNRVHPVRSSPQAITAVRASFFGATFPRAGGVMRTPSKT